MKTLIPTTGLFLVCLLCATDVVAQNKTIDSLRQVLLTQKADTSRAGTLINISQAYGETNKDYPNALRYANEALALAQKNS